MSSADALVSGMGNGILWLLHPDTLEPLDPLPYKHSSAAIREIVFSECASFLAYYDAAGTLMVLRRKEHFNEIGYSFLGKYRSHDSAISAVLFGPPLSEAKAIPRLLSLGEDRHLVEYDLAKSGPYPEPGLTVSRIDRVELTETPLCMAWYPRCGAERLLAISSSDVA